MTLLSDEPIVLSNASSAQGDVAPRMLRLGDLLGEWEADAAAAHQARVAGVARGPVTGLTGLDRELGGAFQPGVHIIHGGPGAGKTAFALQAAAMCGAPALFITTEMPPFELLRRITARVTSTYLGRLKSGELPPAASLDLARRAVAAAPHLVLVDGTRGFVSPDWLQRTAEQVRDEHDHLLIVLDSLHSWADGAPVNAQEYERLNAALAALRGLAGALACPLLAIAERNRALMGTGGLSAGAGTRKIEYGAETVLELNAADERESAAGETTVKVTFAKNRNGAPGRSVTLKFHGALQRFSEE